jgi:hypothetical protein
MRRMMVTPWCYAVEMGMVRASGGDGNGQSERWRRERRCGCGMIEWDGVSESMRDRSRVRDMRCNNDVRP